MIKIIHKGNFKKTEALFKNVAKLDLQVKLKQYAQQGVDALSAYTPIDSGETANSWGYEIENNNEVVSITWTNSNVNDGVPIAIILQYGHGTGTGGYVKGVDYINPAIAPVFDYISEAVWSEVTSV